jgi:hypothetical protein
VPLALIPANRIEMGIYVVGTWIAVAAADWLHVSEGMTEWATIGWPVTVAAVYLPMLYVVLRRRSGWTGPKIEKDRRRPHRLDDRELKVDVTTDGDGRVVVTVTHVPTRLFTTESAPRRDLAERRAHDKLAGILAEKRRTRERDV